MSDHGSKTEISFAGRFSSSAIATCFAEICTIPLDTAKVRLQLQKQASADGAAMQGRKVRGHSGKASFPACIVNVFLEVKNFYVGDDHVGDIPLSKKILAGLTTGAIGITVANPTDLVKVRLQAEGKLPPGVPRRYSGALNAYSTIVRQEGVGALWTGLGPNIARNAIINAVELASYDQVKQTILKIPGFTDNVFTQLLSSLSAGFFAVCIGSPVDVGVTSDTRALLPSLLNKSHCDRCPSTCSPLLYFVLSPRYRLHPELRLYCDPPPTVWGCCVPKTSSELSDNGQSQPNYPCQYASSLRSEASPCSSSVASRTESEWETDYDTGSVASDASSTSCTGSANNTASCRNFEIFASSSSWEIASATGQHHHGRQPRPAPVKQSKRLQHAKAVDQLNLRYGTKSCRKIPTVYRQINVKSRMMGDSAYRSTIDCFVKTMKNEGPLAFYKGFLPNFGRLGSWNVVMFLTLEQVKKLFAKEVPAKH